MIIAACAVQGSCAAPAPPFDHHVDAEHVRLYFDPAEAPCDGAVDALERIARAQADALGLPLPMIDYYLWPRSAEEAFAAAAPCPDARGCAIGQTIWARGLIAHELVHAIEHASRARSAAFFDEGIAVALGEPIPGDIDRAATPPFDVAAAELDPSTYRAAGDFVSYLVAEHGSDRVHAVMDRIPRGASADRIAAAFEQLLGASPEDLWQDRIASERAFSGGSLNLPACAVAPVVAWESPARWSTAIERDGGACAELAAVAIELPSAGRYRIWLDSADGETARFRSCAPGAAFSAFSGTASRQLVLADVDAGRHLVDVSAGSHHIAIEPDATAGDGCAAPAQAIPPALSQLVMQSAPDRALGAAVLFERPTRAVIDIAGGDGAAVCLAPAGDSECRAVASGDALPVAAGAQVCVRSPPGTTVRLRLDPL